MTKTHRFTVRKQSSGYTASVRYYVYDNARKGRVTGLAHYSRDAAQNDADCLNIEEMVRDYDEDPRPYAVRRTEAEAAYRSRRATPKETSQ